MLRRKEPQELIDQLEKNIRTINSIFNFLQCKKKNIGIISVTGPLKVGGEEDKGLTVGMMLQWTMKSQQNFCWERKKEEHLRKKVQP